MSVGYGYETSSARHASVGTGDSYITIPSSVISSCPYSPKPADTEDAAMAEA
ncbi:hypothetical protein PAXINDRAFT_19877 [Paxillus involutus ATCC 200175]|uniref:Uncharacterized protein n=1 Tax=Paxillus involutus ATCC 200175 TaxID=664439 RepID=A0A0C9SW06_PAXIN|nr:hypothetical protein PAXINDRAFT_19877 [Paxillus involutus ATCC 200175]